MMDNNKIISRPKVRFFQFSDNVRDKEEIVEQCEEQTDPQTNRPRIREIRSLEKPVRIVDPTKSTSVLEKNIPLNTHDTDSSLRLDCTTNKNIQNASLPEKSTPAILRNVNDIRNTKKNCKISQLDKSSQDGLKDCTKNLRQKGKENKDTLIKKITSNKNISKTKTGNSQHVQSRERFKSSTSNDRIQKINVVDLKKSKIKPQSALNIMNKTKNQVTERRILNAKPITSNVMSRCKTVTKNKMSPVKKTVLRNVSGPKIKTSVGPGIFCKMQDDKIVKTKVNEGHTATLDSPMDLAQPEYNSIMCIVDKLRELEQQKIVTDIHHLPSTLKNCINGKISAALDFPLDEAIYTNLVDLNIDEKQLPSIITRSKDPEPRQKDMTPKLSDFFIPEDTKEICEAVQVKPRAPKIDENWNAFKISDRILEWKHSIDDID
ncbi:LOW QUALITY PROTEIN: uncharacterized protein LOC105431223 [Pogonomyrmex barbatus]|uniref:LOW QUALITY PROTEIN: uncharacterized protein LOC105431223 n=1 Tax=Pogonomyrmex barbatus TaxID=144034 RepID=A0A6I9WUS0_9HYME|nr:LOW QUALITY PROTEIN: uncharacterized protein LOC105431223 [Pogonomyrmex barbatus]